MKFYPCSYHSFTTYVLLPPCKTKSTVDINSTAENVQKEELFHWRKPWPLSWVPWLSNLCLLQLRQFRLALSEPGKPNLSSGCHPEMPSCCCVLSAGSPGAPRGAAARVRHSKGKGKLRHISKEKSGGRQKRQTKGVEAISFREKWVGSLLLGLSRIVF